MQEEYYYLNKDSRRIGPLSLDQLARQGITGNTFVWKEGLPQWTLASQIPEVAIRIQCGPTPPPPPHTSPNANFNRTTLPPCPPTNLVWAILTTIFCCLPFGIVAIIEASNVEKHYYNGNYDLAKRASQRSANWSIAALVSAFLISGGWFLASSFLFLPFAFL